ncbi:hypothetical protein NEOLI_004535 [Neolecta irregularis DAH-3]|uniref:Uncharacterized protein n=1 Tax=Neolecta irregularis (strain DAH-3) TaxID=1198029 RepID=A0A1U7LMI3_NEOID|nr:hypothetical protein NEOLI_004535 [Neolecta irregularis DAH-3]|eukprot:OLL23793.1 hypothetical protein NEOLI_004535 [Neolecta irregularis DAH-3]
MSEPDFRHSLEEHSRSTQSQPPTSRGHESATISRSPLPDQTPSGSRTASIGSSVNVSESPTSPEFVQTTPNSVSSFHPTGSSLQTPSRPGSFHSVSFSGFRSNSPNLSRNLSSSRSSRESPTVLRSSSPTSEEATRPESRKGSLSLSQFSSQRPSYKRSISLSYERTQSFVKDGATSVAQLFRRDSSTSIASMYKKDCTHEEASEILSKYLEEIKHNDNKKQRTANGQHSFKAVYWLICVLIIYFGLIGVPIWHGVLWWLYYYMSHLSPLGAGWAIFMGLAAFYAYLPLFTQFHKKIDPVENRDVSETALVIPAYKAEAALPETIECALEIFPPDHIFVIANGNSPTPLDDTAKVCEKYGVHHTWVPIGSKITAEYAGCAVSRKFKYLLLIDDDVHLPKNLPIKTDMIVGKTKCVGYTLKSVGAGGKPGTFVQQCQDLEYKLAGITRQFAGNWGSATFPHGAIILWDREALSSLFKYHPGFLISEDWFFGDVARRRGMRIAFTSQVFVETETPTDLFIAAESRGGYGEMTVWKQRFYRWNYFFITRTAWNLSYIFFSWKLGFREIVCKIYVFQEFYETVLYLTGPFVFPLTVYLQPIRFGVFMAATILLYIVGVFTFNYVHLRRVNQSIGFKALLIFFPYKFCLIYVNLASVWYSAWHQAKFWAQRHPRVTKNPAALAAIAQLQDHISPGEFLEMLIGKEMKRKRNEAKFERIVQQIQEESNLDLETSKKSSPSDRRGSLSRTRRFRSALGFGEVRSKPARRLSEIGETARDDPKVANYIHWQKLENFFGVSSWMPANVAREENFPYDDTDVASFMSTSMPFNTQTEDTDTRSFPSTVLEGSSNGMEDINTDDQSLTSTSQEDDNMEDFVMKGYLGKTIEKIGQVPGSRLSKKRPLPDLEASFPTEPMPVICRPESPQSSPSPSPSACSISSAVSCPNFTQVNSSPKIATSIPLIKRIFNSRKKNSESLFSDVRKPFFGFENVEYTTRPINTFDVYAPKADFGKSCRLEEIQGSSEPSIISDSIEDDEDRISVIY